VKGLPVAYKRHGFLPGDGGISLYRYPAIQNIGTLTEGTVLPPHPAPALSDDEVFPVRGLSLLSARLSGGSEIPGDHGDNY